MQQHQSQFACMSCGSTRLSVTGVVRGATFVRCRECDATAPILECTTSSTEVPPNEAAPAQVSA